MAAMVLHVPLVLCFIGIFWQTLHANDISDAGDGSDGIGRHENISYPSPGHIEFTVVFQNMSLYGDNYGMTSYSDKLTELTGVLLNFFNQTNELPYADIQNVYLSNYFNNYEIQESILMTGSLYVHGSFDFPTLQRLFTEEIISGWIRGYRVNQEYYSFYYIIHYYVLSLKFTEISFHNDLYDRSSTFYKGNKTELSNELRSFFIKSNTLHDFFIYNVQFSPGSVVMDFNLVIYEYVNSFQLWHDFMTNVSTGWIGQHKVSPDYYNFSQVYYSNGTHNFGDLYAGPSYNKGYSLHVGLNKELLVNSSDTPNEIRIVCGDNWDDADAYVVCREMGYHNAEAFQISDSVYYKPYATNVNCMGYESTLKDCFKQELNVTDRCNTTAGVNCSGYWQSYSPQYPDYSYPNDTVIEYISIGITFTEVLFHHDLYDIRNEQYQTMKTRLTDILGNFLLQSGVIEEFYIHDVYFSAGRYLENGSHDVSMSFKLVSLQQYDAKSLERTFVMSFQTGWIGSHKISSSIFHFYPVFKNNYYDGYYYQNKILEVEIGNEGQLLLNVSNKPNEMQTVCAENWDDGDASVFCRAKGHVTGKAMKVNSTSNYRPYATHFDCSVYNPSIHNCYRRELMEYETCIDKIAGIECLGTWDESSEYHPGYIELSLKFVNMIFHNDLYDHSSFIYQNTYYGITGVLHTFLKNINIFSSFNILDVYFSPGSVILHCKILVTGPYSWSNLWTAFSMEVESGKIGNFKISPDYFILRRINGGTPYDWIYFKADMDATVTSYDIVPSPTQVATSQNLTEYISDPSSNELHPSTIFVTVIPHSTITESAATLLPSFESDDPSMLPSLLTSTDLNYSVSSASEFSASSSVFATTSTERASSDVTKNRTVFSPAEPMGLIQIQVQFKNLSFGNNYGGNSYSERLTELTGTVQSFLIETGIASNIEISFASISSHYTEEMVECLVLYCDVLIKEPFNFDTLMNLFITEVKSGQMGSYDVNPNYYSIYMLNHYFDISIKFVSIPFHDDLYDPLSVLYKEKKEELTNVLETFLNETMITSDYFIQDVQFSNGSVIMHCKLIWYSHIYIDSHEFWRLFTTSVKSGWLGGYKVSPEYYNFDEVYDSKGSYAYDYYMYQYSYQYHRLYIGENGKLLLNISGSSSDLRSICADGWDDADATVACRYMGYSNGTAVWVSGNDQNTPFASFVNCTGNEWDLLSCEREDLNISDACDGDIAGVNCTVNWHTYFPDAWSSNITVPDYIYIDIWFTEIQFHQDLYDVNSALYGELKKEITSVIGNFLLESGVLTDFYIYDVFFSERLNHYLYESTGVFFHSKLVSENALHLNDLIDVMTAQINTGRIGEYKVYPGYFYLYPVYHYNYYYYGNMYHYEVTIKPVEIGPNNELLMNVSETPDELRVACNDGWDDIDATIFCRELGYILGKAVGVNNSGLYRPFTSDVGCSGYEAFSTYCYRRDLMLYESCSDKLAGINCSGIWESSSSYHIGHIELSIKFTDMIFHDDLYDHSSDIYSHTYQAFVNAINTFMRSLNVNFYIRDVNFSPGSVIVNCKLFINSRYNWNNILYIFISKVESGRMGDHKISTDYYVFNQVNSGTPYDWVHFTAEIVTSTLSFNSSDYSEIHTSSVLPSIGDEKASNSSQIYSTVFPSFSEYQSETTSSASMSSTQNLFMSPLETSISYQTVNAVTNMTEKEITTSMSARLQTSTPAIDISLPAKSTYGSLQESKYPSTEWPVYLFSFASDDQASSEVIHLSPSMTSIYNIPEETISTSITASLSRGYHNPDETNVLQLSSHSLQTETSKTQSTLLVLPLTPSPISPLTEGEIQTTTASDSTNDISTITNMKSTTTFQPFAIETITSMSTRLQTSTPVMGISLPSTPTYESPQETKFTSTESSAHLLPLSSDYQTSSEVTHLSPSMTSTYSIPENTIPSSITAFLNSGYHSPEETTVMQLSSHSLQTETSQMQSTLMVLPLTSSPLPPMPTLSPLPPMSTSELFNTVNESLTEGEIQLATASESTSYITTTTNLKTTTTLQPFAIETITSMSTRLETSTPVMGISLPSTSTYESPQETKFTSTESSAHLLPLSSDYQTSSEVTHLSPSMTAIYSIPENTIPSSITAFLNSGYHSPEETTVMQLSSHSLQTEFSQMQSTLMVLPLTSSPLQPMLTPSPLPPMSTPSPIPPMSTSELFNAVNESLTEGEIQTATASESTSDITTTTNLKTTLTTTLQPFAIVPTCPSWESYTCSASDYIMLQIEDLENGTTIPTLTVHSCEGNCEPDIKVTSQSCDGYKCRQDSKVYLALVVKGNTYRMEFEKSPPQHVRFVLLNAKPGDILRIIMQYPTEAEYIEVYYNDSFTPGIGSKPDPTSEATTAGDNYLDNSTNEQYIILGNGPVETYLAKVYKFQFFFVIPFTYYSNDYLEGIQRTLYIYFEITYKISRDQIRINFFLFAGVFRRKLLSSETQVTYTVEIGNQACTENCTTKSTAPSSSDSTNLTYTTLQSIASDVVNQYQSGNLSSILNVTVNGLSITEAVPPSTDLLWEQILNNIADVNLVLKRPRTLEIFEQPIPGKEGKSFTRQPRIHTRDHNGVHVQSLGLTSKPWKVQVSLQHIGNNATLLGTTMMRFTNGWANFTDLSISLAGSGYVLTFAIVEGTTLNFTTSSNVLTVAERTLKSELVSTEPRITENVGFQVVLDIRDVDTNEIETDLAVFSGYQWHVNVSHFQSDTYEGSLVPEYSYSFDVATGKFYIYNVTFTTSGLAFLTFTVYTTPSKFTMATGTEKVIVYTSQQASIQSTVERTLVVKFDVDFDFYGTDEFLAVFYIFFSQKYPNIIMYGLAVTKGSVLVTATVGGSSSSVNTILSGVCSVITSGESLVYKGNSVSMSSFLTVDGENYYEQGCRNKTETSSSSDNNNNTELGLIIGAVCGGLSVIIIGVIIIVVVWKKKYSNQTKVERLTDSEENPSLSIRWSEDKESMDENGKEGSLSDSDWFNKQRSSPGLSSLILNHPVSLKGSARSKKHMFRPSSRTSSVSPDPQEVPDV